MDKLIVKDLNGKEVEVELILTVNQNNKKYLLYRTDVGQIYASYIYNNVDDEILHNDLSEEEFVMLENIYKKGIEVYDK